MRKNTTIIAIGSAFFVTGLAFVNVQANTWVNEADWIGEPGVIRNPTIFDSGKDTRGLATDVSEVVPRNPTIFDSGLDTRLPATEEAVVEAEDMDMELDSVFDEETSTGAGAIPAENEDSGMDAENE